MVFIGFLLQVLMGCLSGSAPVMAAVGSMHEEVTAAITHRVSPHAVLHRHKLIRLGEEEVRVGTSEIARLPRIRHPAARERVPEGVHR